MFVGENLASIYLRGMRDRSMRCGTKLAREIQLTDWSTAGNLSNRSSGVQIPRDICTRFGRYLHSARCSWIIRGPYVIVEPSFSLRWIKFAGKFFDPLRVIKDSRLLIYLKLVNKLNCMASSVRVISSKTQRQLVVRMRYVRPRDTFGQECTLKPREPVGNYSYRTSSISVRNPSR